MEQVYLSNGQAAYLQEKLGEKYLVKKIFYKEVDTEYGMDEIEVIDDSITIVDTVFNEIPMAKISQEYKDAEDNKKQLLKEVELVNKELSELKRQASVTKQTIINEEKFVINRSELRNAKSIVMFAKDQIKPMIKEDDMYGLKLSFEMSVSEGKERMWGYCLYDDRGFPSGQYLCEKYGVLINPTEEQIMETCMKRQTEFEFSEWAIRNTPDQYLTPTNLVRKQEIIENTKKAELDKLEKQLVEINTKIEQYKAK